MQHLTSSDAAAPAMPFSLTPSAQARVAVLLKDEAPGSFLRISVQGGGCSGFQYVFDFDTAFDSENDLRIQEGDAPAVIDLMSLDLVRGAVLDYVENLSGASFEIKNPNATSSCGCGSSFAL